MRKQWLGVLGLAMLISTVLGGIGLYIWKDRLILTPVVVTVESIPENRPITTSSLKVIQLPQMAVPPGTAHTVNDVNNMWTTSGYSIPKNSFVYLSHIIPKSEVSKKEALKPLERFVSIPVEDAMRSGSGVQRGEHVDIWFVVRGSTNGSFAGKLLTNIEVVGLQDRKVPDPAKENPVQKPGFFSFVPTPSFSSSETYLTIRVAEQDIPYLLSAKQEGTLVVVSRGNDADDAQPVEAKEWLKSRWQGKEGKR
ncbi:RcpC/CpaB family pilus assembly protein [Effusibacillus consociatus]|uniref:RcpC/CpaB family pilus assembly protein n=1 Tax=Effusibacillus consociatus TaxID=1117041 RepID=A0ABV9Q0C2_9BACL